MQLSEQISEDLKTAMKARDKVATTTLRSVLAAIKNARVAADGGGEPDDEAVTDLIAKEAKRRREAIDAYSQAGRTELVEGETAELAVLERYLPDQLDEAAIAAVVDEVIAEVGASGPGDMGKVMGPAMARLKGQADGKVVQSVVKDRLTR